MWYLSQRANSAVLVLRASKVWVLNLNVLASFEYLVSHNSLWRVPISRALPRLPPTPMFVRFQSILSTLLYISTSPVAAVLLPLSLSVFVRVSYLTYRY